MRILRHGKGELDRLAFSPDGRLLAAGTTRGKVRVWDAVAGTFLAQPPGQRHRVRALFFAPDGKELFAAGDEVWAWRTNDFARGDRLLFTDTSAVMAALSPAGDRLAHGHVFGPTTIVCSRMRERRPERAPEWTAEHPDGSLGACMLFSPDGRQLLAGRICGLSWLDAGSGEVRAEWPLGEVGMLRSAAFSPGGRFLTCAVDTRLFFFATESSTPLSVQRLGRSHFFAVAYHPSGRCFASARGDGTVDVWDGRTGQHRASYDWGIGKLQAIAFDPLGDRAAACSHDGRIVLWDVEL